jgi:hypothetical protein
VAIIAPDASPVVIHFAEVFRFDGPVLCQSTDLSTPATDDPRYTSCAACLALMRESQREIRAQQVRKYRG